MSLQDIADCMKGGVGPDASESIKGKLLRTCKSAATSLGAEFFIDAGLNTYQAAITIRGAVLELIDDIKHVVRIATARGFILPESPFEMLEQLNSNRRIFDAIGIQNPGVLVSNASKLAAVTTAYNEGKVTFERKPAYQLSSYEVSVDGLAPQSGDALVDILGYQPDADYIKRKRALDSLAKLDFTKRRPYILFTADYDGAVLIAWSRMHDASGYKITKRDVFSMVDFPVAILENDRLVAESKTLLTDDRVFQILSFYDWLDVDDVLMYIDRSLGPDSLFSFRISGLQRKAPGSPFIFDVPTTSLFMSPAIVDQITSAVNVEAERFNRDPALISPYPALAEAIYGDPSLGWMLAGCNTVAAIRRNDAVDLIRSIGFVGSTVEGLISAGRSGRLVTPQDLNTVANGIEDSVASYGISQTIITVLDGLGLTEFISGKDNTNVPSALTIDNVTSGLGRILSLIDPVTATLDTKLLISLFGNPSQKPVGRSTVAMTIQKSTPGIPLEEVIGAETIDLTTHEGIGRLVQIIRTVYDFYPGALT